MRTILVFPPRTSPTYMPLGVAYLAAVAAQENINLDIFDANLELWNNLCDNNEQLKAMRDFARGPLETFLSPESYEAHWQQHMPEAKQQIDRLERHAKRYLEHGELDGELQTLLLRQSCRIGSTNPESVAFSAMYLDQLAFILALAKYLVHENKFTGSIVIGGAAMSALSPVELLDACPFVTAILTGEGEIPFGLYLQGHNFATIPGCFHRESGNIELSGKAQYRKELSRIAPPDFRLLNPTQYFNPVTVMPILGGRGCKWRRCNFCSHNNSFGPHRKRQAATVVQEMIDRQTMFNCRHFYFSDQYVDPLFLNDLCDALLAAGLRCRFQIMARTIADYTPALLEKAAKAGCCWISWGMESGSQKLLDLMNKGTEVKPSLDVIKNAKAVGISNLLMMIFGAPGSDASCLDENFSFLDQAWEHIDSMTSSAFVLFDQTAYSRNAAKYGLQILGTNVIFNINGKKIHDMKLRFKRDDEPGNHESPLAAQEIEIWNRRKVWLSPIPFVGRLCCEHYLIYANPL